MNKNILPQPPIIIQEKSRENQSKDLAAIIAANSKSSSELSSVWFKSRINHMRVHPREILIYGVITGVALGIMAYILGVPFAYSFLVALGMMEVAFVSFLVTIYRNADTVEYEVVFESEEKIESMDSKITYRIETKKDNRLTMMDLPKFFQAENVANLVRMRQNGQRFNVRNQASNGVCTQQQFPELRDRLAQSNMLIKDGKTWELTDEFMHFAREAVPAPANNLI